MVLGEVTFPISIEQFATRATGLVSQHVSDRCPVLIFWLRTRQNGILRSPYYGSTTISHFICDLDQIDIIGVDV